MFVPRIKTAALILAAGLGLAACTDGYGYGGVSAGYGSAGYYDDYYDPYYGYYDSGYSPYSGWYNGYYYPGTGYYVYDRDRRPYRWNRTQQRYWQARRHDRHGDRSYNDWRGFDRDDRGDRHQWRDRDRNDGWQWRGRNDRGPSVDRSYQQRNAAGRFRERHESRRHDRSHRP